jgi:glyoxylase-like metal-dependent hydrolase (beta-lactamase superfamily II)
VGPELQRAMHPLPWAHVGRTQWAGIPSLEGTSDSQQIIGSIKHKLFTLPDATEVVSGHGSGTTIGDEKRGNMFVR